MKSDLRRLWICILLFIVLVVGIVLASSGEAEARAALDASYISSSQNWCHPLAQGSSANQISAKLSEMTGEAASPLLGITLIGLFKNVCTSTEYQDLLPWYYQLKFLLPALLILIAVMVKDTLLTPLGPLKKPLDALGEIIHVVSGIIVLPIATTQFSDSIAYSIAASLVSFTHWLMPVAYATETIPLLEPSSIFLFLGKIFGTGIGLILFSTIWGLGNVLEVFIFLSPIPFVDTALKTVRTFLITGLMSIAYLNPVAGAIASLIIIVLAIRMFGYSFRILIFGLVYCSDFVRRKWRKNQINDQGILAFSGQGIAGIKNLSVGRLYLEAGSLTFVYYPLLVLPPRRIVVPVDESIKVARGLTTPTISKTDPMTEKSQILFRLPPRYRNQEMAIGLFLNLSVNLSNTPRRRKGGVWGWLNISLD
jgi:hypothetical protein